MTVSREPDSKSPSRRALLAGALGGIGAWAASVMGRANPVRAADDEPVLVGGEYTSTSVTKITNSSTGADVIAGVSTTGIAVSGVSSSSYGVSGVSSSNYGVYGTSNSYIGVYGQSSTDRGVSGVSDSNTGVSGFSSGSFGVIGISGSPTNPAVAGVAFGNKTGVQGFSGSGVRPAAKDRTGVFGVANQNASSKGVWGKSAAGHGVHGESDSGWAGYFDGKVFTNRYIELAEIRNPGAPGKNRARLFVRDNGANHTQLCVRFPNGTIRVLATA